MGKDNLLLIMIFCLCLVGCSKEDNTIEGVLGLVNQKVQKKRSNQGVKGEKRLWDAPPKSINPGTVTGRPYLHISNIQKR